MPAVPTFDPPAEAAAGASGSRPWALAPVADGGRRPRPLASALDALGVMVMHVGLDGRVVAWNRAAREALGHVGTADAGRIDPSLSREAAAALAQRVAAQGTASWDASWPGAAGRPQRVRVAVELESQGAGMRLLCCATPRVDPSPAPAEDGRHRVDEPIRDHDMFRLLFEESPSPKSIQDASFRLIKVNRAYSEMFGYPASRLIGCDPIELSVPEDREMILAQRQRALRGEPLPATLTRRIRRADGSLRICRLMRHTTHASDGSRIELITLHDETEEIRMQQRLRAYWQRFERFFEQAPVGLMISDGNGRVALVNRMLEDIVGRPRDRLIGSPDALGTARFEGDGRSVRQRTTWTRDDGSTRWIDRIDRELEDLDGRPMRLTVVHDVTRERHLRDELMETEERFRQFAERVDDAILVADPSLAHLQYANARFESIWGVPVAELARRPAALFDPVAPADRGQVAAMFAGPAAGDPHEAVVRIAHPRLGERAIRLRVFGQRGAPVGEDGGPARVFAMAEDVTDTLRQERARLDDAIRQRDMLVREVHHRIKNNLQGVAGLLQQSASSRPELADALGEVAGRIHAIAQVHGLQVRDGEDLVLRRVVAAVLDNLGRTFGLPMPLAVDDEAGTERWRLPEQEAVPLALVFNELGTNAIKHRAPGAAVDVRLRGLPDGVALEIASEGMLPAGFDFARLGPAPSGLGLVKALLPRRGARLELVQQGGRVVARAELTAPVLRARDPQAADPIRTRRGSDEDPMRTR